MNNPVTEAELKASAVAPRVTADALQARIKSEHYFTAGDAAYSRHVLKNPGDVGEEFHPTCLDLLTFCVLVLDNGFTVTGQSACADPRNFDRFVGQRLAREDAKNKMWALLGFELRTELTMIEDAPPASMPGMTTHVGTKVIHAVPMTRVDYNSLRGWELPEDEDGYDEGYLVEYADGGKGNVPGFAGYVSWSPKDVFDRSYGKPLG